MSSIVVQTFLTLDGIAQAPGGSDEDREDGFEHGGWQFTYDMAEVGELVGEWESRTEALLLGRKTYDIFSRSWGVWDEDAEGPDGELTRLYNRVPKYVASRTLTEVGWKNSHLLGDDVPAAVARLRDEPGGEIRIWGSTVLIRSLAEHDLIDEYRLMVYPIVLGTGKRLFSEGFPLRRLALVDSRTLDGGVVVSTYRRVTE
ncbi:dihydrofolate reductase family protein [Agromyces aerolatus]|uniref:dihydrofolate reductase family protein n=1 Tax=Agromyces sp. LY-1074 TaxID=3074080 RepID=UPI0028595C4A|nr:MULTISPECIES: dihydrofolate reductase family protein [unclassified Agromyces]MDR5701111.1 dihydrofolate reductase family protein [Agromyces sp. LY-1074]MDR5707751.1 dihydrofolate reductase family protein [Agromyces sp. LY-1358]